MRDYQTVAGDLPDEISRLELRIEELARSAEKCRKAILVSKLAMLGGGLLALALVAGALSAKPLSVIGVITAVIGGIVGYGSNMSTLKETLSAISSAERLRSELIAQLNPRLVRGEDHMNIQKSLLSAASHAGILENK